MNDPRGHEAGPPAAETEEELGRLLRQIRLSVEASGPSARENLGSDLAPLPQQVFLQSMRGEVEHFLAHADLDKEIAEERRLFEALKELGEKLNDASLYETEAEARAGGLKGLLQRLCWPVFRLVMGSKMHRQNQFNSTLVQFVNALAHLEVQVVSVQRHYKAHQSNLGKNLLRVLDLLHQSDLRLNQKIDLLVADLDRRVLALRQGVEESRPSS